MIFEGIAYDITEFKGSHPGGSSALKVFQGQIIDEPFNAQGHSLKARDILLSLPTVGYIIGERVGYYC